MKLRQSPDKNISFKRVGIKQPVQTSRGILNSKRRLKNNDLSVDFSDAGMATGSEDVIHGVQIVDPNNRYKHPKSKLHDSDMGPLAMALGNDVSIQRLPEIPSYRGNIDNNNE